MANWYVYHGGVGATGVSWATAYTTLGAAMAAKAAGDTFFIASDHTETLGAAKTIASNGTEALPCRVISVDRTGSVPPTDSDLSGGAQIITTGNFAITITGSIAEIFGVEFRCGSSTSTAVLGIGTTAARSVRLNACLLRLGGTGAAARINLGNAGGHTVLDTCEVRFGSTSQSIVPIGKVTLRGSNGNFISTSGSIPTTLFSPGTVTTKLFCEGVDFGFMGATKNLILATTATASTAIFKDCEKGAGSNFFSTSFNARGGLDFHAVRCSQTVNSYDYTRANYDGSLIHDDGIWRTGGATDGQTDISWYMLAASSLVPFESPPIQFWNETIGSSITVTIEATNESGFIPNNSQIWIEVYYLGTSGSPLALMATSGCATLMHTSTTYSAGAGGWSSYDSESFAMSVTITPQEKGPVTIYVKGTADGGWHVDPKPVVT